MTLVNIYALDDAEAQNIIASLGEGKHVLGRGGLLNVSDKRVSRKHAIIEVSNNKSTLLAVHVNPCFFKAFNGRALTVITQNQEIELNDGDQFALLPENCWFKVKIQKDSLEESHTNGKRPHHIDLEENNSSSLKRGRWSTNTDEPIPSTSNVKDESLENNDINETSLGREDEQRDGTSNFEPIPSTSNIKDESLENNDVIETSLSREAELRDNTNNIEPIPTTSNIKDELNETSLSKEDEQMNKTNNEESVSSLHLQETQRIEDIEDNNTAVIKEEPQIKEEDNALQNANTSLNNDNNASGSGAQNTTGAAKRERCWYGATCFRKNPNHRASFSHPGDQDYESDPDDDRPDCPYGVACYRQNIDHRRQYKHAAKPAPKPNQQFTSPSPPGTPQPMNSPPKKKRAATKNAPKRTPTKKAKPSDSEDDYDYSDPFLNDGSSDDFEPSDYSIDSSDGDGIDSQEVEESQDRKRMLKEAKKFTRNKKKD